MSSEPLVVVDGLKKWFPLRAGIGAALHGNTRSVKAVDDVSFHIDAGEVLGLVGESGSGKTTVGSTLLRLMEPTAGSIHFDGVDITHAPRSKLVPLRRRMQLVFQDPFSSLNPRMRVGDIVGEPLTIHHLVKGEARKRERIGELLHMVGLSPDHMRRYPHEFSGGQRQRIGIARALASNPEFIVADEPVSALDVSIQAQIVNLLIDLQKQLGLTLLFIAHDLAVVEHISDRIAVMYLGKLVEIGPSREVCRAPKHPYTEALLSAVPVPEPNSARQRIVLKGDIPSPIDPPSGCVFRTRCRYAIPRCAEGVPPLREVSPGHLKACIRDDIL
ncbi:MAG: ATP-binding cassette domain-containing protein [Candidimonas sp.]|nr:MAG: ATP-binding cassette domain-containing protein [Candidimonas sp.]